MPPASDRTDPEVLGAGVLAGRRADLLVLDEEDAGLLEHKDDTILDAAIFGPGRNLVRDVLVAGRWVVRDRHHTQADTARDRYRAVLKRLLSG